MKETNNMNLVKNHLPILEFDTDNKAVIMPEYSTDFHFPDRAVILFIDKKINNYVLSG